MKKFTYFLGIALYVYIVVQSAILNPEQLVPILQFTFPVYAISITGYWLILKRNPYACSSEHFRNLKARRFKVKYFYASRLFRKDSDTSIWFFPGLNTVIVIYYFYLACKTRYYFRLFRHSR